MDEGEQRKDSVTRLIKAVSVIFVAAVLSGVLYGYSWYWKQWRWKSHLERDRALRELKDDSLEKANRRFLIGASVGGVLGLAYVIRCAFRREEL